MLLLVTTNVCLRSRHEGWFFMLGHPKNHMNHGLVWGNCLKIIFWHISLQMESAFVLNHHCSHQFEVFILCCQPLSSADVSFSQLSLRMCRRPEMQKWMRCILTVFTFNVNAHFAIDLFYSRTSCNISALNCVVSLLTREQPAARCWRREGDGLHLYGSPHMPGWGQGGGLVKASEYQAGAQGDGAL